MSRAPEITNRAQHDRGAVIIEGAIIVPILLLMVISILELGMAFKDYLTVSSLAREGARIGALAGNGEGADCAILTGLGAMASPGDLDRIDRIEIFEADPVTGDQGATNVAVYNSPNAPTVCTPQGLPDEGWTITPIGAGWPPASRQVNVDTTGATQLDILGVRVVLNRSWITGFGPFGGSFTVDESTIVRLEPEAYE